MSVRRRQTALSPFASRDCLAQQLRKLCDVGCNPPRLVARYQSRRRSPAGLLLEIDICERLTGLILHNETGFAFLDGPRRREAALGHLLQSSSASRVTAGAAEFLTFTQQSARPERYSDPRRFETMPSQPSAQAWR
jgi:hypothetical protein